MQLGHRVTIRGVDVMRITGGLIQHAPVQTAC
jgi:hypothetical protein